MLAEDEITIQVGRERYFLRPTFRAAMRLERLHGGLEKLISAVAEDNLTVMASIIRETEEGRSDLPRLLESLAEGPLFDSVEALKEPLIKLACQLYGFDGEAAEEPESSSVDPVPFSEHYQKLFRVGTGWLGWTPQATWTATPSEIMEAAKGRSELLKAIFGGSDKAEQDGGEQSAELFNSKLSAVLAMASARHTKPGEAA